MRPIWTPSRGTSSGPSPITAARSAPRARASSSPARSRTSWWNGSRSWRPRSRPGPTWRTTSNLPPVISAKQFKRIESLIETSIGEGGRLVAGGSRVDSQNEGDYLQPTILDDVKPGMTAHREEFFGPVLSVQSFDETEEAIALGRPSGLWPRGQRLHLGYQQGPQARPRHRGRHRLGQPARPPRRFRAAGRRLQGLRLRQGLGSRQESRVISGRRRSGLRRTHAAEPFGRF